MTDEMVDPILAMPEEERQKFLENTGKTILDLIGRGEQIGVILFNPACEETFMEWYYSYIFSEDVQTDLGIRQSIQLAPHNQVPTLKILTRSEIDSNWLTQHFQSNGVFKKLQAMQIGMSITPEFLKMLLAVEVMLDIKRPVSPANLYGGGVGL